MSIGDDPYKPSQKTQPTKQNIPTLAKAEEMNVKEDTDGAADGSRGHQAAVNMTSEGKRRLKYSVDGAKDKEPLVSHAAARMT